MAIDAKELRIGNWVNAHFQTTSFNAPVVGIMLADTGGRYIQVYCVDNLEGYSEQNIDPIPLTTEILEKCGFFKGRFDDYLLDCLANYGLRYFKNTDIFDKYTHGKYVLELDCGDDDHYSEILYHIKYLHQLQNLYYALTNSELNIKL